MVCPLCWREQENFWHFLECQHPKQNQLFNQLCTDIAALHEKVQVDPHLLHMLWQGLNSISQQYSIDDQKQHYPDMNSVAKAT